MIYFSEGTEISFLEIDKKFHLINFLNNKIFTVKDTSLSYRQVNTLDEANIINKDRENKQGWRKFSFKELIFFLIIKDLKKFGLQNIQLKELSDFFLRKEYKYLSDLAIGFVFGQIEISINIANDGKLDVLDPGFYTLMGMSSPHIKVTLNDYVNELLTKIGKKPFPISYTIEKAYEKMTFTKEKQVMDIINNKSYSSITVKKKNGEIYLVQAEKVKSNNETISPDELFKIINDKDFQNIKIIKRDGKIVSHTVEETIKL